MGPPKVPDELAVIEWCSYPVYSSELNAALDLEKRRQKTNCLAFEVMCLARCALGLNFLVMGPLCIRSRALRFRKDAFVSNNSGSVFFEVSQLCVRSCCLP